MLRLILALLSGLVVGSGATVLYMHNTTVTTTIAGGPSTQAECDSQLKALLSNPVCDDGSTKPASLEGFTDATDVIPNAMPQLSYGDEDAD